MPHTYGVAASCVPAITSAAGAVAACVYGP
jgi:hypothetical protein